MVRLPPTNLLQTFGASGYRAPHQRSILKLVFNYCPFQGRSAVLRKYLESNVVNLAKQHPDIEFVVLPSLYSTPYIRGSYGNGKKRSVIVEKLTHGELNKSVQQLLDHSGNREEKIRHPVKSTNQSVRGMWSSLHSEN